MNKIRTHHYTKMAKYGPITILKSLNLDPSLYHQDKFRTHCCTWRCEKVPHKTCTPVLTLIVRDPPSPPRYLANYIIAEWKMHSQSMSFKRHISQHWFNLQDTSVCQWFDLKHIILYRVNHFYNEFL